MTQSPSKPGKQLQRAARKGNVAEAMSLLDKVNPDRIAGAAVLAAEHGHAPLLGVLLPRVAWNADDNIWHLWDAATNHDDTFECAWNFALAHPKLGLIAPTHLRSLGRRIVSNQMGHLMSFITPHIEDIDIIHSLLRDTFWIGTPSAEGAFEALLRAPIMAKQSNHDDIFGKIVASAPSQKCIDLLMELPISDAVIEKQFAYYQQKASGITSAQQYFLQYVRAKKERAILTDQIDAPSTPSRKAKM